jgi:hypothetical protein
MFLSPHLFEPYYIFERHIYITYITILPCILVTRHETVLYHLCVYFQTNLLLSSHKAFVLNARDGNDIQKSENGT